MLFTKLCTKLFISYCDYNEELQNKYYKQEITGEQFNNLFGKDKDMVKIIDKNNINFDTNNVKSKGGLYFTHAKLLGEFCNVLSPIHNIAELDVPNDSKVFIEYMAFKADKINITKIFTLNEYIEKNPKKFLKMEIKLFSDGFLFLNKLYEKEPEKYKELILQQLKFFPSYLKFVNEQTDEMINICIEDDCYPFIYVKNKTPQLYKQILTRDPSMIKHIEQTEELCNFALEIDGNVLKYIKNPSYRLKYIIENFLFKNIIFY